jgi:hypothetical protein
LHDFPYPLGYMLNDIYQIIFRERSKAISKDMLWYPIEVKTFTKKYTVGFRLVDPNILNCIVRFFCDPPNIQPVL